MNNIYIDILESMPLGVVIIDRYGHIERTNKYARILLNFDDRPIEERSFFTMLGNDHCSLATNLCQTEHLKERSRHKVEYNGKILGITGNSLKKENGAQSGAVITIEDITDAEKNQELEKIHEKNVLMGEFSADIAHEIRNPLGSIQLLASLLKKELKRKKDITRVNQILAAVKKMENKISNLVQLSKTDPIPIALVNIHDVLKEILLSSEEMIDRDSVFLSAQYTDIEPIIECNPDMIKQLFIHFILNALQALPNTSRLDIITNHIEKQRMIEITFIERGSRAPENIRSNILNHLSRRKEKEWGLGLAILHNILNICHAQMRVEYLINVGTAFVLSFPLAHLTGSGMEIANTPIEKERSA